MAAAIAATTVALHNPVAKKPLREQTEEEDVIFNNLGRSIENAERTLHKKLVLGEFSSN